MSDNFNNRSVDNRPRSHGLSRDGVHPSLAFFRRYFATGRSLTERFSSTGDASSSPGSGEGGQGLSRSVIGRVHASMRPIAFAAMLLLFAGVPPALAQQVPNNEWTEERLNQWCTENPTFCTEEALLSWCNASVANRRVCGLGPREEIPPIDRPQEIKSTYNGTLLVISWKSSIAADHPEPEKFINGYSVTINGGPASVTTGIGTSIEMNVPSGCDSTYLVRVQVLTDYSIPASANSRTFKCPAPGLIFDPDRLALAEGTSKILKVKLETPPTSNVTVRIAQPSNTDISVDTDTSAGGNQNTLTFTPSNWNTPQSVRVSAARDDDIDNDSARVSFSPSGGGYDSVSGSVSVTVIDKTPKMRVVARSLEIDEGRSDTFIVRLETEPTASVRVTLTQPSNTDVKVDTDTGTSGYQNTLTFSTSNWNVSQRVSVSTQYDEDTQDDTASIVLAASGGNYSGLSDTVSVKVVDSDGNRVITRPTIPQTPHGPSGPGAEVITLPGVSPNPNPNPPEEGEEEDTRNPEDPDDPETSPPLTTPSNPNGPNNPEEEEEEDTRNPDDPEDPETSPPSTTPSNPNDEDEDEDEERDGSDDPDTSTPTTPSGPSDPNNPTAPTNPSNPNNPNDEDEDEDEERDGSDDPDTSTPTTPSGPSDPNNPTAPTNPSNPNNPNDEDEDEDEERDGSDDPDTSTPTTPSGPSDPNNPTAPTNPSNPNNPNNEDEDEEEERDGSDDPDTSTPTTPSGPSDPNNPTAPTNPSNPNNPNNEDEDEDEERDDSDDPDTSTPTTPSGPSDPNNPTAPTNPSNPNNPNNEDEDEREERDDSDDPDTSTPTTPSGPSDPNSPTSPTNPSNPNNPNNEDEDEGEERDDSDDPDTSTPTTPSGPSDPNSPTSPTNPSNPNNPNDEDEDEGEERDDSDDPDTSTPTTPSGPSDPNSPTSPTNPSNPNNPNNEDEDEGEERDGSDDPDTSTPTTPSGPSDPNSPTAPTNPSNPNGPSGSNDPNGSGGSNNPNGSGGSNGPSGSGGSNNPNGSGGSNGPSGSGGSNDPNGSGGSNGPSGSGGSNDPNGSGGSNGPSGSGGSNGPSGSGGSNDPSTPSAEASRGVGLIFEEVPLVLDEGQGKAFRVKLATRPTDVVTLATSASLGLDVEVDADVMKGGMQNTVVIEPSEWNTLRDVKVTALSDEDQDDDHGDISIRASGGNYEGVTDSVSVTVNDDRRRSAWLTRFARTVGLQAIEGIESRLDSGKRGHSGMSARIAGRDIEIGDASTVMREEKALDDDFERENTLTLSEVLTAGTSFNITRGSQEGGGMSFWGRGGAAGYEGETAGALVDGEVSTGMLGVDYAQENWMLGVVGMYSEGEGDFREGGVLTEKEADLTTMIPWAAMEFEGGMRLRGAVGYGNGEVRLNRPGGELSEGSLDWGMLNAGLRKELTEMSEEGGFGLAYTTDFLWTRIRSDAISEWGEIEGEARRIRAGIEGSLMQRQGHAARFSQTVDAGLRHDSGDAEEGWGLDVGAGLSYADSETGLELSLKGRVLVHHREEAARDWGLSAGFEWDRNPGTNLGFSVRVHNESGGVDSDGGMKTLFSEDAFPSLVGREERGMRWRAEIAYGMDVGKGLVGSPYTEHVWSEVERQDRLGYRLDDEKDGGLKVDVYVMRKESEGRDEPDLGVRGILKYDIPSWD